jgi:ketosteroid isomerase-like protein
MKVMVLVKATKASEAGVTPSRQLLTEMGKYNKELMKAGVMLAADGLRPSSNGARIRFSGSNRIVIDGPFAETKELVAGFWLWQVKSLDEAIAWLKRCPNPHEEDGEVEIRPIFEVEDFAEAFPPELRLQVLAAGKSDQPQIRQLISDRDKAVCAKDVDAIMAYSAPDVIYFDVKPPFQTVGAKALRRIWEMCLPYFPDSFGIETRDLSITVSGDLAVAHWLFRFTGMAEGHPAMQTWLRNTAAYKRHQRKWLIVHEHCSVPFDPETSRAVFTLEP